MRPHAPPSSYAIASLIDGEPGSLGRVAVLTLQRSLIVSPGLYLSGLRGRQLVRSSLLASASVTGLLVAWYWLKYKRGVRLPDTE